MGLKDLSVEKIQKMQELLEILEIFGITEEDLRALHSFINNKDIHARTYEPESKAEEVNEKDVSKKPTYQDYINMFTGDTEEFYPDGRSRNNN